MRVVFFIFLFLLIGCTQDNENLDEQTLVFAVRQRDFTACKLIKDLELRDSCIHRISSLELNLERCNDIESKFLKDWCTSSVGGKTGNVDACLSITNNSIRNECLYFSSSHLNNASVCQLIDIDFWKVHCLDNSN